MFPGEYESNLRCPDVGACLPCKERFVSCKNNMNGNYSIPGRPSEYKVCRDGRTIDVRQCGRGAIYDEASGSCKLTFDFSKYRKHHPLFSTYLRISDNKL